MFVPNYKLFNILNKILYNIYLLFFVLSVNQVYGQYNPHNKFEHIEVLANDTMLGRGYTHNGLNKAADYIVHHFDSLGLNKFNNDYKQAFGHSVNVIESAEAKINGKELMFGKDYLVSSDARSIQEESVCLYDLKKILPKTENWEEKPMVWQFIQNAKNQKCIPFISSSTENSTKIQFYKRNLIGFQNYLQTKFIIEKISKLTHSVATKQEEVPTLYLNDSLDLDKNSRIELSIQSKYVQDYTSNNIIGFIKGTDINAKTVLISAHYDHLGTVNKSIFNGANDNASGVSMLLHLAEYYSNFKPKNNIVFVAFAGEELGLLGSFHFVQHSPFALDEIDFVVNLDMAGTGIDGIQVVNATVFKEEFSLLNNINDSKKYLPQIKSRGESCNSDHCPFYRMGIPSFFVYTLGGARHYHDIYDTTDNLSLTAYTDYINLIIDFINAY